MNKKMTCRTCLCCGQRYAPRNKAEELAELRMKVDDLERKYCKNGPVLTSWIIRNTSAKFIFGFPSPPGCYMKIRFKGFQGESYGMDHIKRIIEAEDFKEPMKEQLLHALGDFESSPSYFSGEVELNVRYTDKDGRRELTWMALSTEGETYER